jgi:cell division protein FtsL
VANKKLTVSSSKKSFIGMWILIMFLFIIELLFYAWVRVQCINSGYAMAEETQKQQALIALQNNLKIELARLKAPERIARIAKNQLGLNVPKHDQIIIIK